MKPTTTGILAFAFLAGAIHAQVVIPATPGKFTTHSLGGGVSGGVDVLPTDGSGAAGRNVRYTTHIVLSVSRFWTSTGGKLLEGKLLAYEDMVAEAPQGAPVPPPSRPPAHPTVVRDGKIRLLVNRKVFLVPLARLSQADREFVEQVRKAYGGKTPAAK